jgi:hypothetical protein
MFGKPNIQCNFTEMRGKWQWQLSPRSVMRLGQSWGRFSMQSGVGCSSDLRGLNTSTDSLSLLWRKPRFSGVSMGTHVRDVDGAGCRPERR